MGRSSVRGAAAADNNHRLVNFIYRNRAQRLNSNSGRDRNGRGVLGVRVFIVVTSVNVVVATYRKSSTNVTERWQPDLWAQRAAFQICKLLHPKIRTRNAPLPPYRNPTPRSLLC
jgi:hypothetical protein